MTRKIYSEEEIGKRMAALPEAAAEFLYSAEMAGMIKLIAEKHHLHIDQMSLLEAETGELILGLVGTQEFVPNLIESLHIDAASAEAVAKEINEQVLSKIRTDMGRPNVVPAPASSAPATPIIPAPSVVMPSSPKPTVFPNREPVATPVAAPATPSASTSVPKPTVTPNLGAADAILSEKKVTPPPTPAPTPAVPVIPAAPATPAASPVPKVDPVLPQNYKADPYREPVE